MKQIFITLFSLALCLFALGQNKKIMTKTIDYETYASYTNIDGKATYSYYEDENFREVNHGKFHYVRNFASNTEKRVGSITGMFKNGLRDGLWTFNFHDNGWIGRGSDGHKYFEMKFSLSMNYRNGIPVGQLSYSYSSKDIVKYNNGVVKTFNINDESLNTVLNKNGTPSEYITFKNKENDLKTYKLDGDGFLIDGRFTIADTRSKSDYIIDNNLLTKLVVNGNIKSEIPSEDYRLMYNQARNEKNSSALDLRNLEIKKESIWVGYSFFGFTSYAKFVDLQPFYGEIDKDYKKKYTNFFIHYNVIDEIKKIPYTQNPKWPDLENYTEYEQAIQDCTDFLNSEARVTSEKDIEKIKELIRLLEFERSEEEYTTKYTALYPRLKEIESKNQLETIYNDLYHKKSTYQDKPDIKLSYRISLFGVEYSHTLALYEKAQRFKFPEEYDIQNFSPDGFVKTGNVSLKKSYYLLQEYISFWETTIPSAIDSLNQFNKIIQEIHKSTAVIDNNYLEEKLINNDLPSHDMNYGKTKFVVRKKKDLYNSYAEVFKYLFQNTMNSENFYTLYTKTNLLHDLCNFMVLCYNTKTKDLEKELKATESVPDKCDILKRYMNKSESSN